MQYFPDSCSGKYTAMQIVCALSQVAESRHNCAKDYWYQLVIRCGFAKYGRYKTGTSRNINVIATRH